jgi:hypothetical protein
MRSNSRATSDALKVMHHVTASPAQAIRKCVCARYLAGVTGAEAKASAVKLGTRANFGKDYAQTQSEDQPSK